MANPNAKVALDQESHVGISSEAALTVSDSVISQTGTFDIVAFAQKWHDAVDLFLRSDLKGALKQFRRLLRELKPLARTHPSLIQKAIPLLWFNIGQINLLLDRNSDAAEAFNSSVKVDTQVALSWYGLGIAMFKLGSSRSLKNSEKAFDTVLSTMESKDILVDLEVDLNLMEGSKPTADTGDGMAPPTGYSGHGGRIKKFLLKNTHFESNKKLSAKERANIHAKTMTSRQKGEPLSINDSTADMSTIGGFASPKKIIGSPTTVEAVPSPGTFKASRLLTVEAPPSGKLNTIPPTIIYQPKSIMNAVSDDEDFASSFESQDERGLMAGDYHEAMTDINQSGRGDNGEAEQAKNECERSTETPVSIPQEMKYMLDTDDFVDALTPRASAFGYAGAPRKVAKQVGDEISLQASAPASNHRTPTYHHSEGVSKSPTRGEYVNAAATTPRCNRAQQHGEKATTVYGCEKDEAYAGNLTPENLARLHYYRAVAEQLDDLDEDFIDSFLGLPTVSEIEYMERHRVHPVFRETSSQAAPVPEMKKLTIDTDAARRYVTAGNAGKSTVQVDESKVIYQVKPCKEDMGATETSAPACTIPTTEVEIYTSNRDGFPTPCPGTPPTAFILPTRAGRSRDSIIFEKDTPGEAMHSIIVEKNTPEQDLPPVLAHPKPNKWQLRTHTQEPLELLQPTVFEGFDKYVGPPMFEPRRRDSYR